MARCLCDRIPRVENRTHITVLQHPRERFHPFGTARFVALGLAKAIVRVAELPPAAPLELELADHTGLLFPTDDAMDLETLAPDHHPRSLVVVDGTWRQARCLYRDHAFLHTLPRYRLSPTEPSQYRIRREPKAHCLSSIESIIAALRILEPETPGLCDLLGAFTAMVDEQIELRTPARVPRRRKPRQRPSRAVAPELVEDPERVIVVYGESAKSTHNARRATELFQWVAVRPSTGETFEAFIRPRGTAPGAEHLRHMGLEQSDRDGGLTPSDFQHRWRGFCRDDDVLVGWNKSAERLLSGNAETPVDVLPLKAMYCNVRHRQSGSLDDVIERESLTVMPLPIRGRAQRRLANAVALAKMLAAEGARWKGTPC